MPSVIQSPEVEELLDVLRQLIQFSRAGTPDQERGEVAAYNRARRLLDRYGITSKP